MSNFEQRQFACLSNFEQTPSQSRDYRGLVIGEIRPGMIKAKCEPWFEVYASAVLHLESERTVERVDKIAGLVESGQGSIGKLLVDETLYNHLLQITDEVKQLADVLNSNKGTIGNLIYGVDWPQDPMMLAGFTLLGVVCFASLGVAFAHLIPNEEAAPAYTNAVFLPLIFISGVFYSAEDLPEALKAIAEALPLKHLIDGLSAAIVGGGGDAGTAAVVVGVWAAAGLFLAVRFFRWE